MNLAFSVRRQAGFTLIELLVALGIFLLITGAAFTLLSTSQQRYQSESQVLTSFQEARLGLDQMVRDINDAGFPPPTFFSSSSPLQSASSPFAWSLGAVRYQLLVTTLMRAVANKVSNGDPDAATSAAGVVMPFVQNVVNNTCPPSLPQCQTAYPAIFGGGPVPIFSYACDNSSPPPPTVPCLSAIGGDNSPANIRDVAITLIVAAPSPDAKTGMPRLVQLNGRGRRINPNQ